MSGARKGKSEFAAGYACAVAGLARDHMEGQLAKFLLDDSGIPLKDFERSGLDEYDLAEIRKLFATADETPPSPIQEQVRP